MSANAVGPLVRRLRAEWSRYASPEEMKPWQDLVDQIETAAFDAGMRFGGYASIRNQQHVEERIAASRQEGGR